MNKEIERYIKDKRTTNSDHTSANYKTALGKHFQDFLDQEDYKLEELDTDDIIDLYSFFKNSDLAGSTIKEYLGCIARFLEDTVSKDVAEKVRAFNFDTQSVTEHNLNTQNPILSVEQYMQLCDAAESIRDELVVRLLWETGCRPLELVRVKVSDVERDEETITFHTAKIPADSSRPRKRAVPYSSELNPILREWLDYGGRDKYSTSNSSYLLITERSEQMSANYPSQIIRKVAETAGHLEQYATSQDGTERDIEEKKQYFPNPRHFRNSYITHRVRAGMDLETLRDLAGHHDVSVTARYVQPDTETKKKKNEKYRPKSYSAKHEVARNI